MKTSIKLASIFLLGSSTSLLIGCGTQNDIEIGTVNIPASWTSTTSVVGEILLSEYSTTTAEGVSIEGGTITINQGGSYTLQGTLTDGEIIVDAEGQEVELILNGVNITNSDGAAIAFVQSSSSTITLAEGSTNYLTDGSNERDYDATLYSVSSLTIQGKGTINIVWNYQEGMATDMHLTINEGTIFIQATDDGLNGSTDNVSMITINGGTLIINAEGDGIDSNGSLTINGGTVITASALTDGSWGLDADGTILINGGEVIALGARNSLPATSSTQKSLVISFWTTMPKGTIISIKSWEESLLTYALVRDTQEMVYSSSSLQDGVSYEIYINAETSETANNGIYLSSTGGTLLTSVTTTSAGNTQRSPGGMGGGSGWGGERGPQWGSGMMQRPEGLSGEMQPPQWGMRPPQEEMQFPTQ